MALDVKKAALGLAESNVKAVWKQIIRPLAEEKIVDSENKVDDVILPFMDQLEAAIMQLADKIDGEVGNL